MAEEADPPKLHAWLAEFDAAALLPDLDALGAESMEDLTLLDAGDIETLGTKAYGKLKKLKAKKFVAALSTLTSTPPPAAAGGAAAGGAAQMAPTAELQLVSVVDAGDGSLMVFGARCIEFDEHNSDLLGPVTGLFDDETNPSVSIDEALKGKRWHPHPHHALRMCLSPLLASLESAPPRAQRCRLISRSTSG